MLELFYIKTLRKFCYELSFSWVQRSFPGNWSILFFSWLGSASKENNRCWCFQMYFHRVIAVCTRFPYISAVLLFLSWYCLLLFCCFVSAFFLSLFGFERDLCFIALSKITAFYSFLLFSFHFFWLLFQSCPP